MYSKTGSLNWIAHFKNGGLTVNLFCDFLIPRDNSLIWFYNKIASEFNKRILMAEYDRSYIMTSNTEV